MYFFKCLLFLALIYEIHTSQTLSPKNRGKKEDKKVDKNVKVGKELSGPQQNTVFYRNLVTENVVANDILTNHQAFFAETDEYDFPYLVLGYVTPWNSHGYNVAKIFGNKFTHICPVWLQLRRKGIKSYTVTGGHDIDKQWVIDVRNAGRVRKTKVVPRVIFEGWSVDDYKMILKDDGEVKALTKSLIQFCKKHKFDGFVIEFWAQIAESVRSDIMVGLVRSISDEFKAEKFDFILVVPANREYEAQIFTEKQFDELYDHVTAFSVMTYDYSVSQSGPVAPLYWVEEVISSLTSDLTKRPKLLMGLNFYGRDYSTHSNNPVYGNGYLDLLRRDPELVLKYDSRAVEHFFESRDDKGAKHIIYYPTLFSIFKRLDLAFKLGVGIAIWETGQGLDYFYDLL